MRFSGYYRFTISHDTEISWYKNYAFYGTYDTKKLRKLNKKLAKIERTNGIKI